MMLRPPVDTGGEFAILYSFSAILYSIVLPPSSPSPVHSLTSTPSCIPHKSHKLGTTLCTRLYPVLTESRRTTPNHSAQSSSTAPPWIFHSFWNIIKGWLDPVVASKVHFTKTPADLATFIEPRNIPKELDGEEDWEYHYVPPVPGENDRMKDVKTRDEILKVRQRMVDEYEQLTGVWCRKEGVSEEDAQKLQERRRQVAEDMRINYWKLDPYVRARTWYDRTGVISEGGVIDMYPERRKEGCRPGEWERASTMLMHAICIVFCSSIMSCSAGHRRTSPSSTRQYKCRLLVPHPHRHLRVNKLCIEAKPPSARTSR
ncbi:hypothetical protein MRB53_039380 [Persea americana]|nr:hypothetical protein MRB53_039380 [Persea americana]